MFVTWSVLRLAEPSRSCPWSPVGARLAQAGHAGAGRAEIPTFDGRWWSVLAVWDQREQAEAAPDLPSSVAETWHVVLEPASYRGDAVLAGGARPSTTSPAGARSPAPPL